MTILGKMMAIFVLILSIMQGALTVMLFVSRTNWAAQNKTLQLQVQVANASLQQYQQDYEKAVKDGNDRVAAAEAKINKYNGDLQAQIVLRTASEKELADKTAEVNKSKALVTAAQTEAQLRQADFDNQLKVIKDRDVQIAKLTTDNKREREDRVNAEIAMKTALAQSQRLEEQLKGSMKELAKRSTAGTSTTSLSPKSNVPNPPAENVEGLVSEADASGLVTITIGSDSGLRVGNTLEAFRLTPNPQYLGTLRIRDVRAKEAVAEPMGRMAAPLQRGDHVSSRIIGG